MGQILIFSLAEKMEIVKTVVHHDAYDLVKGNFLWRNMEEQKVRQNKVLTFWPSYP
jgi:hypothetical protein